MRNVSRYFFSLGLFLFAPLLLATEQPAAVNQSVDDPGTSSLAAVGFYLDQGKVSEAIVWLEEKLEDKKLQKEQREDFLFALGKLLFQRELYDSARKRLQMISLKKSRYGDWVRFYLGAIARKRGEWRKAQRLLDPLKSRRKPIKLRMSAREELAELAMSRGHWRTGSIHYQYLERRRRGEPEHPQIVWRLILAEKKRRRSTRSCYWARKMYSKYPQHELAKSWSIFMRENTYEGLALKCQATQKDRTRRIQRWHWAGYSERALQEVTSYRQRKPGYESDLLSAHYHFQAGEAEIALGYLLPHYQDRKKNHHYLMTLAKTAARAREIPAAVGAYDLAHRLQSRNRSGRTALFRSAFLSYQQQDYDGASRRWEKFLKKYPRSGLARDTYWYLAWVKYLKGDHAGSEKTLKKILSEKKRRRRWWRSFPEERALYWLAMNQKKQGKIEEARTGWVQLAQSPLKGYYALLSSYRVDQIDRENPSRKLARVSPASMISFPMNVMEDDFQAPQLSPVQGLLSFAPLEEEESEELVEELVDGRMDEADGDDEGASIEEMEEEEKEEADDSIVAENDRFFDFFKGSRLQDSFLRAKKFGEMGFYDLARWELYEVERKTSDKQKLDALAHQYKLIGSYHRATSIGDIQFSPLREKLDFVEAQPYWRYAYPQAFREGVSAAEREFNVPSEFIWSITKAESLFRPWVRSIVGAVGLMQLMPNTARRVSGLMSETLSSTDSLTEPAVNIRLGTRYLRRLLSQFDEKVPLAAAGYNAGPHRVDGWLHHFGRLHMDEFIEHIPFSETRNYVKKVTRYFHLYHEIYDGKKMSMPSLIQKVALQPTSQNFQKERWDKRAAPQKVEN